MSRNRTILTPRDAAWLADTFARNRSLFGGWRMDATDTPPPEAKPDGTPVPDAKPEAKPDGGGGRAEDKPLGENGEKALKSEREARKKLESELADLKNNLAAAFGVKAEGGKDKGAGDLADVQQQIADMKHENAVLALANQHRITNAGDLELMKATRDADALAKLAVRLAPAAAEPGEPNTKGRKPKPDGTQGGSASEDKPSVSRGRDLFASRHKKPAVS